MYSCTYKHGVSSPLAACIDVMVAACVDVSSIATVGLIVMCVHVVLVCCAPLVKETKVILRNTAMKSAHDVTFCALPAVSGSFVQKHAEATRTKQYISRGTMTTVTATMAANKEKREDNTRRERDDDDNDDDDHNDDHQDATTINKTRDY